MWTDTTRAQYARAELALPSDLTDAEWALLEPFFPPPSPVAASAYRAKHCRHLAPFYNILLSVLVFHPRYKT